MFLPPKGEKLQGQRGEITGSSFKKSRIYAVFR